MVDKENEDQEKLEDKNANGGGDGQKNEVQLTQEQFDAIIKDRLERATAKTTSDLMAQLGIEDVEQAKKTLEDAAKLKTDQMSELERAQAETNEALQQAVQAKADMETMRIKTDEALLKAAIISKASSFHNPMDAWQFIDRSKIETNENGDYTGIDEALKVLAEEKVYLVKGETNGNTKSGTPVRPQSKTVAERLLEKSEKPEQPERLKINF